MSPVPSPDTAAPTRRTGASLAGVTRVVGLLAAELGALATLHGLGGQSWARIDPAIGWWVSATPPEQVLTALARLVGLAVGWWLLASTLLTVMTAIAGWRPRLLHRATPRGIRRLVEHGLAASLLASTVAPSMALAAPGPPIPPSPTGTTRAVRQADWQHLTVPQPQVAPPAGAAVPVAVATQGVPTTDATMQGPAHQPRTTVAAPGDHLWGISARVLRRTSGAAPSQRRIARYWRTVVAANRQRLISGDPDVIHPGEKIVLPPRSP